MYNLCECLRITAQTLRPFLIETPGIIWASLGMPEPINHYSWESSAEWGLCPAGNQIHRGKPLFPRIETEDLDDEDGQAQAGIPQKAMQKKTDAKNSIPEPDKGLSTQNKESYVTIDEFRRFDLRVAEVTGCEG